MSESRVGVSVKGIYSLLIKTAQLAAAPHAQSKAQAEPQKRPQTTAFFYLCLGHYIFLGAVMPKSDNPPAITVPTALINAKRACFLSSDDFKTAVFS